MSFIWTLIVGGLISWLAGALTGRDVPGGIIGNIIAGFIGAWLGSLILEILVQRLADSQLFLLLLVLLF